MVAATQESMKQVLDTFAETARNSFETGRRFQESWFEALGTGINGQTRKGFGVSADGFAKQWFPMIGANLRFLTDASQEAFQANLGLCRLACDTITKVGEKNFAGEQNKLAEAGFAAVRTTMTAFGKAGQAIAENWSTTCRSATCGDECTNG